jgi:hypothetical protein
VSRKINLVVTCASRKTRPVSAELMLRSLRALEIENRFFEWRKRLKQTAETKVLASELYAGDHWYVSQQLTSAADSSGLQARLWIASAGYGLIKSTSLIAPYAATFSVGQPDSVNGGLNSGASPKKVALAWWAMLGDWVGPSPGTARQIWQLASDEPEVPLLVIVSDAYFTAIGDDLKRARKNLRSSDTLCIISAGTENADGLTENMLPCDARLQQVVGGSLISLNVRIARKILLEAKDCPIQASVLSGRYGEFLSSLGVDVMKRDRKRLNDPEIREYISNQLKADPGIKPSPLLQRLRDEGFACEQSRFSSIYREVRGTLHDSSKKERSQETGSVS